MSAAAGWSGAIAGALGGLGAGLAIALAALFGVWWERKVAGRMQMRYGPQQAGPVGLLQTLADTLKLLLKEDITPRLADPWVFRWAPVIAFVPCALSLLAVPVITGWAPMDTTSGALLYLAIPSISVIGVLIGGWSSGNTYATLGGMRGAAQMIAYEVPRTLSVLAVVVLAGTIRPVSIMAAWRWWWIPLVLIAFVVFVISSIAEMNRGPFDLPEAESELVAGYFADYSGIRWAIFMMTEYGGMLAVSLFASAIFLGGTHGLPGALGFAVLLLKAIAMMTFIVWVKWTFPRFRSDQLMALAWKVLTPLALLQILIVGAVVPWL